MKKVNQEKFEKEFPVTDNKELAKRYECSESVIRILAAAFHVKKGQQSEWSLKDEAYVIKNYGEMPIENIVKKLGRTRWSIINKNRELSGKTKKGIESKLK